MALTVSGLTKRFGERVALEGINLNLSDGVVALLGANGSGKSTLLRILATLITPDSGMIVYNDCSYTTHQRQLRAQIGYAPQDLELPDSLTPRKFLNYLANLRGGQSGSVITKFQIETIADTSFSKLSGGQLRQVGIAQAFLGTPRLLLLDEPSRGLDTIERELVFRIISQHPNLAIFSTHIPEEAESVAQSVIVLHRGRIVFCGAIHDLRSLANGHVYEISIPLESLPQYTETHLISRTTTHDCHAQLRIISQSPPADATPVSPTLEDAYLLLSAS